MAWSEKEHLLKAVAGTVWEKWSNALVRGELVSEAKRWNQTVRCEYLTVKESIYPKGGKLDSGCRGRAVTSRVRPKMEMTAW